MKRFLEKQLQLWKVDSERQPLILRGARQVGKTHLVREFGKEFTNYVEINLERQANLGAIFQKDLDPNRILQELSIALKQRLPQKDMLLFIDEIQEEPQAITALRYFYEELPEIHIIAAGSLLDLVLEEVGVPVGRVTFLYLYPMSFFEFLEAIDQGLLLEVIQEASPEAPLPEYLHEMAMDALKYYLAIGGMPKVVDSWIEHRDWNKVEQLQNRLVQAYISDFPKYAKKSQVKHVSLLCHRLPHMLGQRFQYQQVGSDFRKRELAPALELLQKALVFHAVYHTAGHGLPLMSQADLEHFKVIGIDIAFLQNLLGMDPRLWVLSFEEACINKGMVMESFVGQEFLASSPPDRAQNLFYWNRNQKKNLAEVDYLIAKQDAVIPVEVKSGNNRHLKSLHSFLEAHPKTPYGIHLGPHAYGKADKVLRYPLYAAGKIVGDAS